MAKLTYEKKEQLSRKEVAAWFASVAKSLASDGELEVDRRGESISLEVDNKIHFEFEISIDGDETEVEIELKWRNAPAPAPAKPARARTTRTRRAAAAK
jgi:amphi-Trp domain-containing protein